MAKKRSFLSRWWLWLAVAVVAVLAAFWTMRGDDLTRTAEAGTAYAARVACSCRFVADRSLDDCGKDLIAGMELVSLSEDSAAKSVTATIPFIAADTAQLRDGYGCVLKRWED